MQRRTFLRASAAALPLTLAGCLGGGPSPPDEDAAVTELLPSPPDGWERTGTREVGGGFRSDSGIETAIMGTYTPDREAGYTVAVYRFASVADAEEIEAQLAESGGTGRAVYFLRHGNFLFRGGHNEAGTDSELLSLLARVPSLTEEYVRENNLL